MENRIIKFRAWDYENKQWLSQSRTYEELADQAMWNPEKSDYFKLMQYTGLKDSKGVEIYEGDRLIYYTTSGSMSDMGIKFADGCFVGEGPFITRPLKDYLFALDFQAIEVIGNIYETPELLNK